MAQGIRHPLSYCGLFWCKQSPSLFWSLFNQRSQQDILIVCDPQALKHIFHSSHPYPKSQDNVFILDLVVGKGLVTVDGESSSRSSNHLKLHPMLLDETHRRQRKIMNPAFSLAQLQKAQVIFQQCSDKVSSINTRDNIRKLVAIIAREWYSRISGSYGWHHQCP